MALVKLASRLTSVHYEVGVNSSLLLGKELTNLQKKLFPSVDTLFMREESILLEDMWYLPYLEWDFLVTSSFLYIDKVSTVAKPHHRIWRLEESTSSLLIASQQGQPSFCLRTFSGCNFQNYGGWLTRGRTSQAICCWVNIRWCCLKDA